MSDYKIPEPFVWSTDFQVFYKTLDDEHKGLFEGIFACNEKRDSADALNTLRDRVGTHFKTEEDAMDAAGYPCEGHKQKHKDFVEKLAGLSGTLSDETIHYAMDWLVNHIKGTDFHYKGKLNLAA
uniref:Hemerythrin n=2 Tax=Annelida TaxID=6340 RepID=A0A1S6QCR2_9ANNE|nr:hemerythrin [Oenone fulgida]AQV13716.1 hemerythrin [Oligochaeta sp. EP-2017]